MRRPVDRLPARLREVTRTAVDLALDPVLSHALPNIARPVRAEAGGLEIRRARLTDLDPISKVFVSSFARNPPAASLARLIRRFPALCFVAESQEAFAGYALCRVRLLGYLRPRRFKSAFVASIAVDGAFRGKGLGRALTERVLDTSAALGLPEVSLEVEPDNSAAVSLYKSCGFLAVKGRRGLGPNSQIMARRTVRAHD